MFQNKIVREIFDWISAAIIALAVAVFMHAFIIQPTRVSGESMDNTLHNGEYLAVSKIMHDLREEPNYGDIVIIDSRVNRPRSIVDDVTEPLMNYVAFFDKSAQAHYVWVKRVIGRGGDTIQFKDGAVWRNGEKLDEPYIKEPMKYYHPEPIKIPEGYVFVMGDNRNHSNDSRFIGSVPVDHVLGRVVYEFTFTGDKANK